MGRLLRGALINFLTEAVNYHGHVNADVGSKLKQIAK